jgi:peptidoglycan/xylan/chitin deacetylase (PgdA/CDA1 family)
MRFVRPWFIPQLLYPGAVKRIKTDEKILFLTFDDGPDNAATIPILEILDRHSVPAVFFCSGRKAEQQPDLMEMIKAGGHATGNHGYDHLDGWLTSNSIYLSDIHRASAFTSGSIFRPPYGRISPLQYRSVKEQYKIYFWDLMPYDFDERLSPKNCCSILLRNLRPGSVIALHDTAQSSAGRFLGDFISGAQSKDYRFALLQF